MTPAAPLLDEGPTVSSTADSTDGSDRREDHRAGRGVTPGFEDADQPVGREALELLDEQALRRLLATQPVIEQAKGLLMGCYRLDADQAFALLRRWSSYGNDKVRDLAARLVDAAARPGPGSFHPSQLDLDLGPAGPDPRV